MKNVVIRDRIRQVLFMGEKHDPGLKDKYTSNTGPTTETEAVLVFPNQLFEYHPCLKKGRKIYIIQYQLFFDDWQYPSSFSKKKLLLHLSSLKNYYQKILDKGYSVTLIKAKKRETHLEDIFRDLGRENIKVIFTVDPSDYILEKRLRNASLKSGLKLEIVSSPSFLCKPGEEADLPKSGKRLSMTSFYITQRKRFNILIEGNGKPSGGKWSLDPSNRRKMPSGTKIPDLPRFSYSSIFHEARRKIESDYSGNPGTTDSFIYPVTRSQALELLNHFLEKRLIHFGDFEDSMSPGDPFMFHSMLSSSLNTGLLTPDEIIKLTVEFVEQANVNLNNLEGFIRQILGWREFMHLIYRRNGNLMRKSNYWDHNRTIPKSFLQARTGIPPIDISLKKVYRFSYAHHIERLMLLGNFLLLCEVHPDHVYSWFMSWFIDAYDWVMVPNIYGMSQFADGGSFTTKPYICSSNYLLKMGQYDRGDWCDILDALYWRFVYIHRKEFSNSPRQKLMSSNLDRMGDKKLTEILEKADHFLEGLQ